MQGWWQHAGLVACQHCSCRNVLLSACVWTWAQDKMLHRSVKPGMLSSFGDLALAVGPGFPHQHIDAVMSMLVDASTMSVPDDDEDLVEFLAELRMHILEGFTGLVQGLNDESDRSKRACLVQCFRRLRVAHCVASCCQPRTHHTVPALTRFVPDIARFLATIASDPNRNQKLVTTAVALIGSVAAFARTPVAGADCVSADSPGICATLCQVPPIKC